MNSGRGGQGWTRSTPAAKNQRKLGNPNNALTCIYISAVQSRVTDTYPQGWTWSTRPPLKTGQNRRPRSTPKNDHKKLANQEAPP